MKRRNIGFRCLLLVALLLIGVIALASCGGGDDTTTTTAATTTAPAPDGTTTAPPTTTPAPATTYTVTFKYYDKDGAERTFPVQTETTGKVKSTKTPEGKKATSGYVSVYSVVENDLETRHQFKCWTLDGAEIDNITGHVFTGDVTVVAKYTDLRQFAVKIYADAAATEPLATGKVWEGEAFDPSTLTIGEVSVKEALGHKIGFYLSDWYDKATSKSALESLKSLGGNVDIYPSYSPVPNGVVPYVGTAPTLGQGLDEVFKTSAATYEPVDANGQYPRVYAQPTIENSNAAIGELLYNGNYVQANLSAVWDGTYIYFGVEVYDPTPLHGPYDWVFAADNPYQNDSCEIWYALGVDPYLGTGGIIIGVADQSLGTAYGIKIACEPYNLRQDKASGGRAFASTLERSKHWSECRVEGTVYNMSNAPFDAENRPVWAQNSYAGLTQNYKLKVDPANADRVLPDNATVQPVWGYGTPDATGNHYGLADEYHYVCEYRILAKTEKDVALKAGDYIAVAVQVNDMRSVTEIVEDSNSSSGWKVTSATYSAGTRSKDFAVMQLGAVDAD